MIIEIIGNNKTDISGARYQIDLLIEASKNKLNFTHFISIPVNSESIKEHFNKFKDDVLMNYADNDEFIKNIFIKPDKLHLTISVLLLCEEEDYKKAVNTLEACNTNIIK
jgi:activating signal cointegrator complex subunit 1